MICVHFCSVSQGEIDLKFPSFQILREKNELAHNSWLKASRGLLMSFLEFMNFSSFWSWNNYFLITFFGRENYKSMHISTWCCRSMSISKKLSDLWWKLQKKQLITNLCSYTKANDRNYKYMHYFLEFIKYMYKLLHLCRNLQIFVNKFTELHFYNIFRQLSFNW